MPVSEICSREAIFVQPHNTVLEAARLMREHHVGDVVVAECRDGVMVKMGIVTEHDLVVGVIAPELDYMVITVGDIVDLHEIYGSGLSLVRN